MPQVNQPLSVSSRVTVFETGPRHFMRPSTVSRNLAGKTINSLLPLSAVQYIDIYQGQFEDFRLLQLLNTSTYQFQSLRCSDIRIRSTLSLERKFAGKVYVQHVKELEFAGGVLKSNDCEQQGQTTINKHQQTYSKDSDTQRKVTGKSIRLAPRRMRFPHHRGFPAIHCCGATRN